MSGIVERINCCATCDAEHIQTAQSEAVRHRRLCAAPGTDSKVWLVMDTAFMQGPDSYCPKGKWAALATDTAPTQEKRANVTAGRPGLCACPQRGQEVGERDCVECGNRKVRLKAYACPFHAEGATYKDCGRCNAQNVAPGSLGKCLAMPWGEEKGGMNSLIATLPKMGYATKSIMRAVGEWKDEAIAYIHAEHPSLFVGWQRLYPKWGTELKAVLDAEGIPQVYVDFGIWPHYGSLILDGKGENATSSIVGALDDLEADPKSKAAADAAMPKLQAMRADILRAAEEADEMLPELGLAGLPEKFVYFAMQRTGDSVTKYDAPAGRGDFNRVLVDVIAEAKRRKRFVVVKLHPADERVNLDGRPLTGPHYRIIPRNCPQNERVNAWLMTHCAHIAMVNSTMHFSALAVGCPVVALGLGWFTGNRVVSEFRSIRGAIAGPNGKPDAARAERYLLHMLSRQLAGPETRDPKRIAEVFDLVQSKRPLKEPVMISPDDVTTVTTVYASDKHMEYIVRESLTATAREFPESRKIAAVDLAAPEFIEKIKKMGFEVLTVEGGEPPRMSRLLKAALDSTRTPYFVTVECDVAPEEGSGSALVALLAGQSAKLAGVEAHYVDAAGALTFPTTYHSLRRQAVGEYAPGMKRELSHITWSMAAYRTSALRLVDWSTVPPLGKSDIEVGRQLRERGLVLCNAPGVRALHRSHQARQSLAWAKAESRGEENATGDEGRPVKVAMTLMVKNEIELIRRQVEFHQSKIDLLIVTDNGSTDGTLEYLRSIQGPKVVVLEDADPVYHQAKIVTRMARMAAAFGVDWIINSDCDEFWAGDLKRNIQACSACGANALSCLWLKFVPTLSDDAEIGDALRRMTWRLPKPIGPHKVVHRAEEGVIVHQGNHGVTFRSLKKREVACPSLPIFHFPERSYSQFTAKVIQGGAAYEKHPNLTLGEHWRRWYGVYLKSGEPGLQQLWRETFLLPQSELVHDDRLAKGILS